MAEKDYFVSVQCGKIVLTKQTEVKATTVLMVCISQHIAINNDIVHIA